MDLYPAIDLLDGRCVRLYQGDYDRSTVYGDDPVAQHRISVFEGIIPKAWPTDTDSKDMLLELYKKALDECGDAFAEVLTTISAVMAKLRLLMESSLNSSEALTLRRRGSWRMMAFSRHWQM